MTATIIPFPTSGPARHTAVGAPVSPTAIAAQAPPRADAGLSSLARTTPTDPAARSATPPARTAATARPGVPAIPYAGPCRRLRSARIPPGLGRPASAPVPHAAPLPAPSQPDRLARALDSLRVAFVQQNAVLAAWRASLADLLGASASLHTGLAQHDAAMRDLDARLSRLQATPQVAPRALTR